MSHPQDQPAAKPKSNLRFIAIPIAIVVLGYVGFRVIAGKSFESTDDAYVTADIVQVSSELTGALVNLNVTDNQLVHKGDVLATIDTATYQNAEHQAEAGLALAQANLQAARADYDLTAKQGSADIKNAQAGVVKAAGGLGSTEAQTDISRQQLLSTQQATRVTGLQVSALAQEVVTARASLDKAQQAAKSAQAMIVTAQANVASAKAGVVAAQAQADQAKREQDRVHALFQEGAVSQQEADLASTKLTAQMALVDQAQKALDAANANVLQRQADYQSAIVGISAARAAVQEAILKQGQGQAQVAASRNAEAAQAAAIASARQGVKSAEGTYQQAAASVQQAQTLPSKLQQKRSQIELATAQVKQAQSALATAKLNLTKATIIAPVEGVVAKRYSVAGQFMAPGTPIVGIVPTTNLYVVANFKETQMERMHQGESVDVEVDGFPGQSFKATVESLSPATGSQFALIPPDNATGNYVKVVQRVPVRVKLEPDERLSKLAAGMSAVVKVKVG